MSELDIAPGKWLGARVRRVEDPRYLTGEARYVADLTPRRALHAAFVRSPHAHARIGSVDTTSATAMPGVAAILAGSELDAAPLVDLMEIEGLAKTPQPALAWERVRFAGEAVAVVIAESRYTAEDAAERVVVEYEELPALLDVQAAAAPGAPLLFDDLGSNVLYRKRTTAGEVDTAFAEADRVLRRSYHTNRILAAPMETRGVAAEYEAGSGRLTVWSSTQNPELLRLTLASVLPLSTHKLRVVAPEVGGGFGQKAATYPEEVAVAFLALRLGRPVQWIEDRREHLLAATHGKEQLIELEAAVTERGRLLALRARFVGDAGAYSWNTTSALIEPQFAATLMPGVYDLRNYEYEVVAVLTNKTPVGPYRGVGWTAGHTARELLLDEIARELRLDPAELRRRNMIGSDRFPYETCTGALYDSGSFREALDRALELVDYEGVRREQAERHAGGRYLGIGISPYVEPTAFGSEIGMRMDYPIPSHDNATVTVDPAGKVRVALGVTSQGQGHRTVFAQLAASVLGVGIADVEVIQGDTDTSPFGMGTYASRAAVIGGGAIALACGEVRKKLLDVASALLEAAPSDLTIEDSLIFVAGSPDRSIPLSEVAGAAYFVPDLRPRDGDPFLASTRFYDPHPTYSNGCIACVAEVDAETGIVELRRIVAVEDCGTVINPTIVEGQVRGAIAQGIGSALLEHLVYDEFGQPLATTYLDYLLPTATDVPRIEVEHLETPSPVTVGGIKGMGESGLIASPAAVANAVADAVSSLGATISELPLSPETVLRAIGRLPRA